jgi:hypothetical protein
MYCESSTRIRRPFQTTVALPGSSVVSDRNGRPSTRPSRTADRRRAIGKSGLVIAVGCVKDGGLRSTRLLGGAQPRPLYVPHGSVRELESALAAPIAVAQLEASAAPAATAQLIRCRFLVISSSLPLGAARLERQDELRVTAGNQHRSCRLPEPAD